MMTTTPLNPRRLALRIALPAGALLCLVAVIALWRLPQLPGNERTIAAFSTSVRGRTHSQIHNVRLALASLDGAVIKPDKEFSFNRTVGPWSVDRGYRRAPVSFSGEMVRDWGGGVCQASTTLYNAVLLAGLPILERHRHHWPSTYAPPGQDAAVAYPGIDLRFRNCLPAPVRISARIEGESIVIRLHSRANPPRIEVEREVMSVTPPATVTRFTSIRRAPVRGQPGCEVAIYRRFLTGVPRRELVSRDQYPPLNRLVWR